MDSDPGNENTNGESDGGVDDPVTPGAPSTHPDAPAEGGRDQADGASNGSSD